MSSVFTLSSAPEAADFKAGLQGVTPDDVNSPGFFAGALPPIADSLETGAAKLIYSTAKQLQTTPEEVRKNPSMTNVLALGFDRQLENIKQDAFDIASRLKPDPKVTGWVGQTLYGLGDIGYRAAAAGITLRNPLAASAIVAKTGYDFQVEENKRAGLDEATAKQKAMIEGGAEGLGVLLPMSFGTTILQKLTAGAAINMTLGGTERGLIEHTLDAHGYSEQAKQYRILDGANVASDFVMGMFFGGVGHVLHAEPHKEAPAGEIHIKDAVMPSDLDDATAAKVWHNNEIDQAPGYPVDAESRNAHAEALDTALKQTFEGKPVEVSQLVKNADFVAPPHAAEVKAEIDSILKESEPVKLPARPRAPKAEEPPIKQALSVLRGETKTKEVAAPESLSQFVAKSGGVKDTTGDLKAIGAEEWHKDKGGKAKPFQRKIINDKGRQLDDMALKAWEAGFFPTHAERPTINEFLDSLEGDIRGIEPVRRPEDVAAHADKNSMNAYIDSLDETLHRAGIDINTMKDADIIAALEEYTNPKAAKAAIDEVANRLLADHPDLMLETEEGKPIRADQAIAEADKAIKEAEDEASLYDVAVDCFLGGGE